jgi:hypothetical protein
VLLAGNSLAKCQNGMTEGGFSAIVGTLCLVLQVIFAFPVGASSNL